MAYDHQVIEKKWQQFWEEKKVFSVVNNATSSKKKFYALDMFPYPSGAGLHVGHPEGYTATDIICRKKRMEGYEVLHPMGWDAFGLPAENFAIKTGVHPNISTQENIKNFTRQIKSLGFSYDWDREIDSTDPNYYKWTQWLFLKFYEKGLLYEEEKPMNWCPSCKVVCANEEVEQGLHERCGNAVSKKSLKQWMFKITQYAQRLLEDLEKPNVIILHGWGGKGSSGWFAELKKYLEENTIEAFAPDMPNTALPQYAEWKAYFDENFKKHLKRNTILVGHSLGGGFIQRYLTEENVQVGELFLVAPTVSSHGIPEIANFFDISFDYETIKKSVDNIFIVAGGHDPYITKEEFETLSNNLSAHFSFFPEEEHFWGDRPLDYFPSKAISSFFEKVVTSQIDWPEKIKLMQKNWIGKSTGLLFTAPLIIEKNYSQGLREIQTYSTHCEAFYADTFVVIAPDHPLLPQLLQGVENREEIEKKCAEMIENRDKRGFEEEKESDGIFTGRYIADPIGNGNLPIWVASYALADYGTGIVKCSCHDERDFAFAKKFNIPLKPVLFPENPEEAEKVKNLEYCFSDMKNGILSEPSEFAGKKAGENRDGIIDFAQKKGFAVSQTNYRLRDWIFTRQRYWGEPIPLVFDENGICYPLDESELPVILPDTPNYEPSESGESPLAKIDDWVNVKGEITEHGTVKLSANGSKSFRRETSTMPNWAGSSWYWLRFMDARNEEKAWSKESEEFWGPVDLYVGGAEHAVLHLLYARFWHKALYDMGLVSTKEPFKKLVNQGLILSYAYQRNSGGLVPMDEVEEKMVDGELKYFETSTKEEVKKIVAKMSKSLKNVVNPDDIIAAFGADTLRMYEMFMGPFEQSKAWDTAAVEGMHKFLARIHRNFTEKEIVDICPPQDLVRLTHQTVKKVSDDIDSFKFNTAISQLMIWMNEFAKLDYIPRIAGGRFVRLLAPFAPHLAEELWNHFKPQSETITFENWPSYEEKYLVADTVVYAVQVNGKLRADFEMPNDATKEEVLAEAKKLEKVQKYLSEGEIKKEVFVPGKIVGFVVG